MWKTNWATRNHSHIITAPLSSSPLASVPLVHGPLQSCSCHCHKWHRVTCLPCFDHERLSMSAQGRALHQPWTPRRGSLETVRTFSTRKIGHSGLFQIFSKWGVRRVTGNLGHPEASQSPYPQILHDSAIEAVWAQRIARVQRLQIHNGRRKPCLEDLSDRNLEKQPTHGLIRFSSCDSTN